MNGKFMDDSSDRIYYGDNDYHTMYYGEIVDVYKEEKDV